MSTGQAADRDKFCIQVYAARPGWVKGIVGFRDARFLFERVLAVAPRVVVEVGTASGMSTAILAHALELSGQGRLFTYDLRERFYEDETRLVGDAAREMVPPEVLERITFRNPAVAIDAGREHKAVDFAFIDGNHRHPWPALDLLALLDALPPGAEVALHDINLPIRYPGSAWGAKWLYDELDVEKRADERSEMPDIGSVTIPTDKDDLREQLLRTVHAHEWESDVRDEALLALLG